MITRRDLCTAVLATLGLAAAAGAEQFQRLGEYQAHYNVLPTTFLNPEVAADYGITRARDRALVNVAVVHPETGPVQATVTGTFKDLLGTVRELEFTEVVEGDAVYYLATLTHGDRETMRFAIDVRTPDGRTHALTFQQKLYWEDR